MSFPDNGTRQLNAELVDYSADKIPADCGYQTEWGILKFRVIENGKKLNKDELISVLIMCPREKLEQEIGIKNLKNGSDYNIKIGKRIKKDEIPENVTIISDKNIKTTNLIFPLIDITNAK